MTGEANPCCYCEQPSISTVREVPLCLRCLRHVVLFDATDSEHAVRASFGNYYTRGTITEVPCLRCGADSVSRDPSCGGSRCTACGEEASREGLYQELVNLRNQKEGLTHRVSYLEFCVSELEEKEEG